MYDNISDIGQDNTEIGITDIVLDPNPGKIPMFSGLEMIGRSSDTHRPLI